MGKFLPFSTQGHCIDLIVCPTRAGSDLRRVEFDGRTGSRSEAPVEPRLTVGTALQSERRIKSTTYFLFENQSMVDFQKNSRRGAILMKMAVFFFENAFCVGLFQSFYDGGDLDENGCFLFENAFCVGLFQSFYDGGDLDENGCFPQLKRVLRWTFLLTFRWGRS